MSRAVIADAVLRTVLKGTDSRIRAEPETESALTFYALRITLYPLIGNRIKQFVRARQIGLGTVPGVVGEEEGVASLHRQNYFLREIDVLISNSMAFEWLFASNSAVGRVIVVLLVFDEIPSIVAARYDPESAGLDIHILKGKPAIAAELRRDVPVVGVLVIVADAPGILVKKVILHSDLVGEELDLASQQRGHGFDEVLVFNKVSENVLVVRRTLDADWHVGTVLPFERIRREDLKSPVAPVMEAVGHFKCTRAERLAEIGWDKIMDKGVAFFPILGDMVLSGHDSMTLVEDWKAI